MSRTHSLQSDVMRPARWAVTLVVIAIVAAMSAPLGVMAAQTPTATSSDGIVSVVPDTALAFAQINLDENSDQMVLARQLSERAGIGDPFEQLSASEEFPENANVGIVVTSIPEADNLDVANVSVDPSTATDSLDEGGFAAIISAADPQAVYDSVVQDSQADGEVAETEHGGVTISTYTPPAGDDSATPTAVAMVGDYVVIATRAEDIHPVIDTFNGDTPNLTTNENYQRVNELLPAESISSGYFDGPAVLAAVEATAPGSIDALTTSMSPLLNAWTGYALSAEQDGFRLVTKSIPAGDDFPEMTPIDGSFFDKVRSDALFAANGTDIDATGALTMLAFVFASEFNGEDVMATPAADFDFEAEQQRVFAQAEQMLGFNLKTDLIDHLQGEFGISVSVGDINSSSPDVNALIVSHVDDPAAVTETMTKVAMIAGAVLGDQTAVQQTPVGDSTVNTIDISDSGIHTTLDFGVVGEDLVIGVGSGMNDYANGAESPMSAESNFNAVMEHMPTEYGSLSYVNMPVVLQLVVGLSETTGATDADPACGEFATQAEAQAAYDEDQFENYELDQDFDGEACEDFFSTAAATPEAAANPYPNIIGLATVTTQDDGIYGSDTFLLIGGE